MVIILKLYHLNLVKHLFFFFIFHYKKLNFLGKVKTLSALNLDGNPLIHPPFEIVKQGIKSIQQYLRDKLHSDTESSSDDDRPQTPQIFPRKSKYFYKNNKSEINSRRI